MPSLSGRRLRIGIDGREFTKQKTGIARLLEGALKEFCRLRPEWEFFLFGNQETIPPFEGKSLTFLRLPERPTFWWDQLTLVQSLKKERIDLFLSSYYKIPLFSPCPAIPMVHDLIVLTSACYRSPRYFLKRSAYYLLGLLYAHRSALILTDSHYSKRCIERLFKISGQKIQIVYPGLDKHFQILPREEFLKSLQERHRFSSPYLLYVGNFKPHKRVDCLLEAYSCLPKALREKYPLILVGTLDPNGLRLKKMGDKLGLSGQAIFTDYVDDDSLIALYKNAHLFVFPSSEEGFGLPPVEAMTFGIPVIASRAASIPEVVGDAASLVSPGDPKELSAEMRRLLENDSLRLSLARKGLERARFFSVETQAESILLTIEKLLGKGL